MASFDHGLSLGADGVELDVHLSRDGVVVVHHDDTLDRTTDAQGPLAARTADELARVDAGYWFTPDAKAAAPVVSVPRTRDRDAPPARRARSASSGAGHHRAQDGGGRAGAPDDRRRPRGGRARARRARLLPWTGAATRRGATSPAFRRAPPAKRRGGRSTARACAGRSAARRTGSSRFPSASGSTVIVTPRFIAHAHRAGLPVRIWTVDDRDDMLRLLEWGADSIISDRPDIAVPVVREWAAASTGV